MAKKPLTDEPEVEVRRLEELHDWLAENHRRETGVWLVHHKKASPNYIAMGEIVDECLCWGWVDSLVRSKDDLRTMHYIAPRNPASNWSRVNKDKISRLAAEGRLQPKGRELVEQAQSSGTWTALDDVENGVVPPDLSDTLTREDLRDPWDALPRSVQRGALEILLNSKRATTRQRRIDEITKALAAGGRPFQWVPKS